MTPSWWYTGWLAGLTVFLLLMAALMWLLFRWGQREVDKLDPINMLTKDDIDRIRRLPP